MGWFYLLLRCITKFGFGYRAVASIRKRDHYWMPVDGKQLERNIAEDRH